MPYYNSAAKTVIVAHRVSTLLVLMLFASLPLGYAVVQPLTGLLNITQIQFSGRLVCSSSGNLPPGSGSLGAAGTLVSGSCNGASGDLGTAITNTSGFFQGVSSIPFSILFNSTQGMPCSIIVTLPATGSSCELFPPRGILQAGLQLLSLAVNAAGQIIAVVGASPFQYVP